MAEYWIKTVALCLAMMASWPVCNLLFGKYVLRIWHDELTGWHCRIERK